MNKETFVIQAEGCDPTASNLRYSLPNGDTVTIGKNVLGFFEKLQSLPPITKAEMMILTEEDMYSIIAEWKNADVAKSIHILSQKWYWKETGDPAEVLPDHIPEVNLETSAILKKLKTKPSFFSRQQLQAIINFYTGDRTEVYIKENQNKTLKLF